MTNVLNLDLSDAGNAAFVKDLDNIAKALGLNSRADALGYSMNLARLAAEAANQGKVMGVVATDFNHVAIHLVVRPTPEGALHINQVTGSNFNVNRIPGVGTKP